MIGSVSTQHERAFTEIKRLTLAGLDGPELLRRVAAGLGRVISFDAYCASTTDPASNLMTHGIAEGFGEDDGDAGNVYLDRIYFEEGLDQISSMLRQRRAAELLSEATGGEPNRSMRYRELLRPQGFAHEVSGVFTDGGLWGGMDLMRAEDSQDFAARDIGLVERVAPHVGSGLKAAALNSQAIAAQDGPDIPGVLTLSPKGRVLSHTPAARRWLQDLEDLHPAWRESDPPVPVRMVAGALRRALSPTSDGEANLIPRMRVRGRSGRWLALYGSLTEPAEGQLRETVVIIEPAKPEDVAWLNVAAHGLTPREEEVIRLVVRGLSNHQISQTLFISEYTVQRHLANIFEKVGVRSRKSLLKRLFFDSLLPSM